MNIDKFIPRQLNTDSDERLLKEGEMLDAINVTLDPDGDSTVGVLKNVRGTRALDWETVDDAVPTDALTVIGSVSDPQRNRIYFFAANNDNTGADYIYYVDTENTDTATYQVVFQRPANGYLNFDPNSFIKADVVNRDFNADGTLETILYFTDNINPPRAINVDRALAGEYDGFNNVELDYVINTIKAAPKREPTFNFDTDTNFSQNNFKERCFQFATQFVYEDNQESALSPYSRLAFIDSARETSVDSEYADEIFSSLVFENNVIEIDTMFRGYVGNNLSPAAEVPTVDTIRILAREDNDGAWFIIDEVDANANEVRNINGTDTTIYNSNSGIYRWYNNGGYRTSSTLATDKLYDNVPLLARGQTFAGNRIVYSNYEEGYNNDVDPDVNITVVYNDGGAFTADQSGTTTGVVDFIVTEVAGVPDALNDDGSIVVDFDTAFSSLGPTDQLNPGSVTTIQFTWEPQGHVDISDSDSPVMFQGVDSAGDTVAGKIEGANNAPYNVSGSAAQQWSVSFSYTASEGDTVTTLANAFSDYVSAQIWSYTITPTSTSIVEDTVANDSDIATFPLGLVGANHTVGWQFVTESTSGVVYIQPYIYVYTVNHDDLYVLRDATNGQDFSPDGMQGESWWKIETQSDDFISAGSQTRANHTYNFSNSSDDYGIDDVIFRSDSVNTTPSFKAGAMHEFAMMYYDEYNRNGPLLRIGSTYVEHTSERDVDGGDGLGPVEIQFDINHDPPDWATSYKILYPGNSSFQSVWTGTVQNSFVEYRDNNGTLEINPNKRHLYLSIEGNEELKREHGINTSYAFNEGDILRVISYNNDGTEGVRAQSSQPANAPLVEFNVVRTVTLDDGEDNPLKSSSNEDLVASGKTGRFIVVEAPQVDAGIPAPVTGGLIQYQGWDWWSRTNTNYPYVVDGSQVSSNGQNRWKKEAVVEILTPLGIQDRSIFYEISDYRGIGIPRNSLEDNEHGPPFTINNGDVYFRPVICSINDYSNNAWTEAPSDRRIRSIIMESDRFSDRRQRIDWGKGRAHFALTEGENRRRFNAITYSDKLIDDLNNNYLHSFDKNSVNYIDLNPSYGAVNYIDRMGDRMVVAQENKIGRMSVGERLLRNADGTANSLALTDAPFNLDLYYSGDYGIGDNPESALVQDGQFFFADVSRNSIVRLSSEQLYPISEKRCRSLFNELFEEYRDYDGADGRIVSGYDPDVDMYYVTFIMGADSDTVGYSVYGGTGGKGAWISRYTFLPTNYANQNNLMYSTLWNDPNTVNNDFDQQLFWAHDADAYNTFHGNAAAQSDITFVSKKVPSQVKVFDAISYEGNSANWNVEDITTNLGSDGDALPWTEREGSYYAYITRDVDGSKHITVLGSVDTSDTDEIVFQQAINNIPVPSGAELFAVDGANLISLTNGAAEARVNAVTGINSISTNGGAINTANTAQDTVIVAQTDAALNSDPIRGHWAQIRMTNAQATQHELYCVNLVITPSLVHHPKG